MGVEIETPPRAEGTPEQQLRSLQSYLHRMAQQLQWAFGHGNFSGGGQSLQPGQTAPRQGEKPGDFESVFLGLKNMIIKSADIVESYSDRIRKDLEGEYVAKSQFGTYQEKTSQQLEADARTLNQLFSYTAEIRRDLENLAAENASTKAYIRTGLLKEGAFPVYGLEIGQRNLENGKEVFRKYARFTADRLSFFDGSDVEVAYVSDYTLCITNARISGSLELGARFALSFDNGLVFAWKGGTA